MQTAIDTHQTSDIDDKRISRLFGGETYSGNVLQIIQYIIPLVEIVYFIKQRPRTADIGNRFLHLPNRIQQSRKKNIPFYLFYSIYTTIDSAHNGNFHGLFFYLLYLLTHVFQVFSRKNNILFPRNDYT